MNKETRIKILKVCGPVLVACGVFGFFYVMYGGASVKPKDVLVTIFFFVMGMYFTWLSQNPDKLDQWMNTKTHQK